MGSTSAALTSQLQFNLKQSYFERFGSNSIRTQLSSVQAQNPRTPILSLRARRRSSGTAVCFAVDDDLREKQIDLGGGGSGSGIGSAVEDRPGEMRKFNSYWKVFGFEFYFALYNPFGCSELM